MHKQDKKHKIMLGLKHSVYVVWNRMDYFLYGSSGFTAVGLIMLYAEILFHLLFWFYKDFIEKRLIPNSKDVAERFLWLQ